MQRRKRNVSPELNLGLILNQVGVIPAIHPKQQMRFISLQGEMNAVNTSANVLTLDCSDVLAKSITSAQVIFQISFFTFTSDPQLCGLC